MGKIEFAHKNLCNALDKLEQAIESLEFVRNRELPEGDDYLKQEVLEEGMRDSLIQRFEFCVDLFWKYLKKYLENFQQKPSVIIAPTPTIRAACSARLVSEADADEMLEMVKSRNITSHIYQEEMADRISVNVPKYYKLMLKYVEKLAP